MKYIRKYESELYNKAEEYKKYEGKYIIIETTENKVLWLGKLKKIVLNGYFANLELYDYDTFYKGWIVDAADGIHLSSFGILVSFDDFEEAKEQFEIIKNSANKYNL